MIITEEQLKAMFENGQIDSFDANLIRLGLVDGIKYVAGEDE